MCRRKLTIGKDQDEEKMKENYTHIMSEEAEDDLSEQLESFSLTPNRLPHEQVLLDSTTERSGTSKEAQNDAEMSVTVL